jgi:hypothetical protein
MLFKILLSLVAFTLSITIGANCFASTQAGASVSKNADLAAMRLENVQIEAQSIGSLFSELALSYNIPIGLEVALKEDASASYVVDFKKGTLAELLSKLVTQHRQYDWQIRDGVVYVFPKDNYRDALFHHLLETKIRRFSVRENTSCWTLTESLAGTPEMKKILEANGTTYRAPSFTGPYIPQVGRHFKLDVSDLTLKSILDRVIRQSSIARFWVMTRNQDGSLNISLAAMHEDFPRGSF